MVAEHATLMVVKVNLKCYRCFLKVKKVLGNLPQIGDQWEENEVRISVICGDPEKIRRKLYSKAGKAINKVDIKLPAPKSADTKADPSKTPKPLKMPGPVNGYPLQVYPPKCGQCYDGDHGGNARLRPPPNGPFGYGYEYGYGAGKAVDVNYFSEENPSGCSIM